MKVILYMAMSLNGYIADSQGTEDFLSHQNWEKFCSLAKECGNFIVGRKTYEAVKNWNEGFSFDDLVAVKKVIISQDKNYQLPEDYILVSSPEEALLKLNDQENILVTGGPTINTAFIKANLLDEIILNIEPAVIGQGLNLFKEADFENKLELIALEPMAEGIVNLRYKVKK